MAALNFPDAPTIGLVYDKYTWDGQKWILTPSSADPDVRFVNVTGDTMTGALVLPADPTLPLQSATKQYADTGDAAAIAAIAAQAVRYDTVQTLTETQKIQTRSNIYAAPLDALAYNGMQMNGAFLVSQEKGGAGTVVSSGYFCDGWTCTKSGSAAVTFYPIMDNIGYGPYSSLAQMTVQTAQASIGASEFVSMQQMIEGVRVGRLMWGTSSALPITIGFWCQHHRTGTWSGAVRNSDYTRSYVFAYTQNVADVPEYKTVTIPGDTAGTWLRDTSVGLRITFGVAVGSLYTAPAAGVWYGVNYVAAPGQVNGVGATNDVFRLTGVIVLPGTEAPSAARSQHILRPADQELVLCQRHWCKGAARMQTYTTAANNYMMSVPFPVTMRATPVMAIANVSTVNGTIPSITTPADANVITIYSTATATGIVNFWCDWTADARLT